MLPTSMRRPGSDGERGATMCDRSSADKDELAELYPEGRHLYYEGDDPVGFIKELKEKYGLDVFVSFHCPAELLDEIESGKYQLGT
jgi:hypothetical protein